MLDKATESLILEALKEETCLKTVNNYGENLLHVAAANGCSRIVKEILKQQKFCETNRKNVFGWTPLMQAIRNGKIDCVKILLENKASATELTYHGTSTIELAAAVGREMFEIVYKASPAALELASGDDVCLLSITAMKNDKKLFFRLLELGLQVSKANTLAHLMMKSSVIPEISALAKPLEEIESYWNDCSDNIEVLDELQNYANTKVPIIKKKSDLPNIYIEEMSKNCSKFMNLNDKIEMRNLIIPDKEMNSEYKSLISPTLTYNSVGAFPLSPKPVFPKKEQKKKDCNNEKSQNIIFLVESYVPNSQSDLDRPLQRCQNIRPPDLELFDESIELNNSLSFIPDYSPTKSPNVPPQIEDENAVFGEITPTPPHGTAPPKAFILSPRDAPMAFLLHKYGLGRFISIFLEQEVDVEVFLTLNNEDLKEIGIESEMDRRILLSVIDEIKRNEAY